MTTPDDVSVPQVEEAQRLSRVSVPELDALLGVKIPVLDDGFIRVIDYMGADEAIVQAARVSYGRGTKKVNEDRGLIRYLLRHWHTTPFEMCEIKFHFRIPMDAWRQWIRHRTANVNEYSTRYSIAIDSSQRTQPGAWRLQSQGNRQGSSGFAHLETGIDLSRQEAELQHRAREVYNTRLAHGVAREQARKDLPLSTYTEAYWKVDLHNLLHFLRLRMDEHAQLEIREYARAIGEQVVAKWVPYTWEAFQEYRVQATQLTLLDQKALQQLIALGGTAPTVEQFRAIAQGVGFTREKDGVVILNREGEEFVAKAQGLGLVIPPL
jgi:thymidylate synthase (FAD)